MGAKGRGVGIIPCPDVQAFWEADGTGSRPQWALQQQKDSIWDVISENKDVIIIGGGLVVSGCLMVFFSRGITPHKDAKHAYG